MKYIVTWPDPNTYGDNQCAEVAGSKEKVTSIIEDWLTEQDNLSIEDFAVYELGNEIPLERKVLLKESVIVR